MKVVRKSLSPATISHSVPSLQNYHQVLKNYPESGPHISLHDFLMSLVSVEKFQHPFLLPFYTWEQVTQGTAFDKVWASDKDTLPELCFLFCILSESLGVVTSPVFLSWKVIFSLGGLPFLRGGTVRVYSPVEVSLPWKDV